MQRRRRAGAGAFGLLALAILAAVALATWIFSNITAPRREAPIAPALAQEQIIPDFGRTPSAPPNAALIVPIDGVAPDDMADSWGQARAEGRTHEGVDILAPAGAPVRAAVDGRIVKFFDSERGGITIYQFDRDERFVYYYAHLQRRADALREGDVVRQGQLIGYVGMTGNAPIPHLHFEIQRLTAERKWWEADSLNPYPYLISGHPPAS